MRVIISLFFISCAIAAGVPEKRSVQERLAEVMREYQKAIDDIDKTTAEMEVAIKGADDFIATYRDKNGCSMMDDVCQHEAHVRWRKEFRRKHGLPLIIKEEEAL